MYKIKHIVAAALGRVAEINNGNFISVIFFGYGGGISKEIRFAVGCDERHSRRTAVFNIGVKKICGFAHARSTNH